MAAKKDKDMRKDVKVEQESDDDGLQDESATNASLTPTQKRGRKTANNDDGEDESPTKKSKKGVKRGTIPIPTSYESAGKEDRMLLHMKDVEKKNWAEIKTVWEAMTGIKVGNTTLSTRYIRMKANFTVFEEDDRERLLEAKKEIEEKFESEKWAKIAAAIEEKGGKKYPPAVCQKKFKEFSKRGASSTNANANANPQVKVDQDVQGGDEA